MLYPRIGWLVIFTIWGHLCATPVLLRGLKAQGHTELPAAQREHPLPPFSLAPIIPYFFPWGVTE